MAPPSPITLNLSGDVMFVGTNVQGNQISKDYSFNTNLKFSIPDGKPTQEQVDALVKLVFIKAAQQVPENLFPNLVKVSNPVANIVLKISYNGKESIYPLPEKKYRFTVKDSPTSRTVQASTTAEDSVSPSASLLESVIDYSQQSIGKDSTKPKNI